MAKDKKSSEKSTPRKTAAKKSAVKKVVAPSRTAAEELAVTPPVVEPRLTSKPIRTPQPAAAELYDEIRRRAYEFYRERGGQHGSHEADWHRAEAEVRAKYKS
jgi:hypothetical protein